MQIRGYTVIDDFYTDPDSVREFALTSRYRDSSISGTRSLISDGRHPDTRTTLERIAHYAGCTADWQQIQRIYDFWEEASCGEFQLRLANMGRGRPHSHNTGQWVGIVYLSRDDHTHPGTYLLRHNPSGAEHFSDVPPALYQELKRDSLLPDLWTVTFSPQMKYNRLFLFDSRLFHAESEGFGTDTASGRLVQIFNFISFSAQRANFSS